MTVASCPSCQERVTVPVDATSDSVVRCPFCHEEFELKDFLNQLPPSLIVLENGSGETSESGSDQREAHDVFSRIAAEAESDSTETAQPAGEAAAEALPPFEFTPGSASREQDRQTTRSSARRTRKSPTIEGIKIVAGALLAVPAAQVILWWFVPAGYKRDLLGLGPSVSRVAPWVVPQQFHAGDGESKDARLPASQSRQDDLPTIQQRRGIPRSNSGSALPAPGATQPNEANEQNEPAGKMPSVDARTTGKSPPSTAKDEKKTNQDVRKDANKAANRQVPAPKQTTNHLPHKAVVRRGVRDAPQYTLESLRSALERAIQASIAWDADSGQSTPRHNELSEQFYQAFARLSEAMTYPPPDAPEVKELAATLNDILKTFQNQPEKLAMIGNQTAAWLKQSSHATHGIFIFGTVETIQRSGNIYQTELEVGSREQRILTVVSRVDPRRTFDSGDRILMLGAMVEQPDRRLVGYEGQESMVVMGGFPVVLR